MSDAVTFAGVKTKPTTTGRIRRPAFLKMLRSGQVEVRCAGRTTDDSVGDNLDGHGRGAGKCPRELADEIANDSSGWYAELVDGGQRLVVSCHSFLSYNVVPEGTAAAPTTYKLRSEAARRAMAKAAPRDIEVTAEQIIVAGQAFPRWDDYTPEDMGKRVAVDFLPGGYANAEFPRLARDIKAAIEAAIAADPHAEELSRLDAFLGGIN